MSAPLLKPTVMFADHVSTLGGASPSVSVISALPRKPASSKRGTLNGMLIGLMGIVFGLGIMYLLSRLMQVSRRQQQIERQVKDTSLHLDELAVQMHILASAPKLAPVAPPRPAHVAPPAAAAPVAAPATSVQVPVDYAIPAKPQQVVPRQMTTFVDFPLPLLFDDGDALLDFFVNHGGGSLEQLPGNENKVEEIVDVAEERKETDVKSIVQQTMEPIARVVDELKKQSEKTASSSDDDNSSSEKEDEQTKQPPARRSTRAVAASRRKK